LLLSTISDTAPPCHLQGGKIAMHSKLSETRAPGFSLFKFNHPYISIVNAGWRFIRALNAVYTIITILFRGCKKNIKNTPRQEGSREDEG